MARGYYSNNSIISCIITILEIQYYFLRGLNSQISDTQMCDHFPLSFLYRKKNIEGNANDGYLGELYLELRFGLLTSDFKGPPKCKLKILNSFPASGTTTLKLFKWADLLQSKGS